MRDSGRSAIRLAQPEDKEAIQRIYDAVVGPQASQDEALWDRLIQRGGLVVVTDEGRIVGFGGIDVHAAEQVKWLYLLPQHQRAGLGSELLRRLESIGWEAGLDSLRVHSAPRAVHFYRRHGYRLVETHEHTEHDHEGVEMTKARP
jgi:ribosomal protein S18 acetylase RimI-like enzyme